MNTTHFFATVKTVAEVKQLYRTLAMQHHPDRGGDTATMQEVNRQYKIALQKCDGQTTVDHETKREHTYKYNTEHEQAVIDFIDKLIRSGVLTANVDAWLIGIWVWIQGDTKPIKDKLKELGCMWHSKRLCWYWHPPQEGKTRYNSRVGLDGIARTYGASKIARQQHEENALAA